MVRRKRKSMIKENIQCKKCKSRNVRSGTIHEDNYGEAIGIRYTCLDCGNQHTAIFDDPNGKETLSKYFAQ